MCACVYGVGGCWETGAFSLFHLLKPQRIFFLHPVSISYSRCHSVCHFPVCHTKTTVEWDAGANKQQVWARAFGRRAWVTLEAPPPNTHPTQPLRPPHSFSYSRVQFSESYLGYYSNPYPHQRTPTSGQKNSCYQFGHSIGRRAKVWGCPPWFSPLRRRVWQTEIDRRSLPCAPLLTLPSKTSIRPAPLVCDCGGEGSFSKQVPND